MNTTSNKFLRGMLSLWSLCGISILLFTAVLYARWNGFAEQGEVNFSSVSWLLYQGYPLYTDIDYPGRYSLQHGPIVYLIAGAIMKLFGPSYITAKISGIIAFVLSILTSWVWFSKLIEKKYAFFLLGLETWLLFHWHHAYFIRPDSMMLLCVVVSMYIVTTKKSALWLILGTAIPLAVMANLKIHGVLYFLPIIFIAYQRVGKKLLYAGAISALLGGLPFLLPQISLNNYLLWLFQSFHHGFTFSNFIPKVAMFMMLFLLPITIGIVHGVSIRSFYLRNKHLIQTLLFSLIVISIISSKGGSGTNHLMPFIPIFIYLIVLIICEAKDKDDSLAVKCKPDFSWKVSSIVLALLLVTITASGINTDKRLIKVILASDRTAMVQDVQGIETLYRGKTMEVGYGEDKSYPVYRDLIPLPVFNGSPLLIEAVALGDMNLAGWSLPASTIKSLEEGTIQVWLIPKGETPFAMNFGSKSHLCNDVFRETFFKNYSKVSSTAFFDIWVHANTVGVSNSK